MAVDLHVLAPGLLSLLLRLPDGRTQSFRCVADPAGDALLIDGVRTPFTLADPRSLRATSGSAHAAGPRPLRSPMPGRIVRVLVAEGDPVEAGQACVVMEAMKMQNELKAPKGGRVQRLSATVGETVPANHTLLVVD
jgi:biotin carboxyl carrier protein